MADAALTVVSVSDAGTVAAVSVTAAASPVVSDGITAAGRSVSFPQLVVQSKSMTAASVSVLSFIVSSFIA